MTQRTGLRLLAVVAHGAGCMVGTRYLVIMTLQSRAPLRNWQKKKAEPGQCRIPPRKIYVVKSITITARTTITAISSISAASAAAIAATTGAGRPVFLGPGDVNREVAAIEAFAVQCGDGGFRTFLGFHGHEAEPTRTAAEFIHDEIYAGNSSMGRKHILKIVLGHAVGEISDEQFSAHDDLRITALALTVPDYRVSNHH